MPTNNSGFKVNGELHNLQSTVPEAAGTVNLISPTPQNQPKQVTVQQHMKKIHCLETKTFCLKVPQCIQTSNCLNTSVPNYSTAIKSLILKLFLCTTTRYLLGRDVKMSSALCIIYLWDLPTLGVRNALWSTESFNSSPFVYMPCKYTVLPYNTPGHRRNAFLGLYLVQGWPERSAFQIRLAPTCISWVSNQLIVTLIVCLLSKVHVARLRGCCCNYGNHTWREVFSFMHVLQTSPCKSAGPHSHQSSLPMY